MEKYDFLVVGAGLFGSVFAHQAGLRGKTCLVVEKRGHVGGNVYTEVQDGIPVHKYGCHIWHTASRSVWDFLRPFADFNNYSHRGRVQHQGMLYSFPINLLTLHQVWGVRTPAEAEARLAEARIPCEKPANLEEWMLSQVGREIYEIFVEGYTAKQWGRHPTELPASIIKRLPIRLTHSDRYFPDHHRFEGQPVGGFTPIIDQLLGSADVQLGVDFLAERESLARLADRVVYTGPLDAAFGYRFGPLEYRSLRFEHETLDGDFQGHSCVNYAERDVPFTRIIEHKHFEMLDTPKTIITREFPDAYTPGKVPYYPINDDKNAALSARYKALADQSGMIFGGRLASYQYWDMDQTIANALHIAAKTLGP